MAMSPQAEELYRELISVIKGGIGCEDTPQEILEFLLETMKNTEGDVVMELINEKG